MTEREFADIVHQTKSTVLKAIARHLPAQYRHAIDDIAQETYFRAYKTLAKNRYREEGLINSWLYTIAKNETLRMIARLNRHDHIAEAVAADIQNERAFPEIEGEFRDIIIQLPDTYRPVMELVLAGHSEDEISKKLNIPVGTVKSRKSRGKNLLYKMLKKENYIFHDS